MTRVKWLLPFSLGLLLACDGSDPASPDGVASLTTVEVASTDVVIDIQPIPDLDKAVVNLRNDHVRVAVLGASLDPSTIDVQTVAFVGVPEMHLVQMDGPNCDFDSGHFTDVDGDGLTDAVFHFSSALIAPIAPGIPEGGWCLTAETPAGPFTACEAGPVKVMIPTGH